MSNLLPVLPFVGIALLFWFLLIRPAQRRQREMGSLQRGLTVGDEVMLTSGIFGVVRSLDEETLQLEVAPGSVVKVARAAVGRVTTATPPATGPATGPVAATRDDENELTADGAEEPEEK